MEDDSKLNIFVRGLKVFDVIAVCIGFGLAAASTLPSADFLSVREFFALRLSIGNLILFAAMLLIWGWIFAGFGLYTTSAIIRPKKMILEAVRAGAVAMLVVGLIGLLANLDVVTPTFLIWFYCFATAIIISGRFILTKVVKSSLGRLDERPRLLIVGINSRSIQIAEDLRNAPELSHQLIGFVDDSDQSYEKFENTGFKLVTDIDNIAEFLRATPVDEVLICLPMKSRYDDASHIVSLCEEQGIKLRILADLFQYRITHSRAERFGNHSVITVAVHGMMGIPDFVKRCLDLFVSATALLLLSPLFLVIAAMTKFGSSGPVLFTQERIGLNKKRFRMIKFRTMVVEAEGQQAAIEGLNEASGPAFKIKNDPRITPVGKMLRRTSLDELPQLINVFKGEMSLVGPRPLPLRDYAGFSEDWHRRRVSVRPGLTGLWQVESRDHSSFDNWMKLDMQYIDEWSLWLDLKIILKTIPAVLRGSGD